MSPLWLLRLAYYIIVIYRLPATLFFKVLSKIICLNGWVHIKDIYQVPPVEIVSTVLNNASKWINCVTQLSDFSETAFQGKLIGLVVTFKKCFHGEKCLRLNDPVCNVLYVRMISFWNRNDPICNIMSEDWHQLWWYQLSYISEREHCESIWGTRPVVSQFLNLKYSPPQKTNKQNKRKNNNNNKKTLI